MFLRGGVTENWPQGGFDIYQIQEQKTGAARGCSPTWTGFNERDVAVMHEIMRRWNATLEASSETSRPERPSLPFYQQVARQRGEAAALAQAADDMDKARAAYAAVTLTRNALHAVLAVVSAKAGVEPGKLTEMLDEAKRRLEAGEVA